MLQVNFVNVSMLREPSELTGLGHEGDVVTVGLEGPVEGQLEAEELASAQDEPLHAHLLCVVLLVVPGAVQVHRPELQCCH